MEFHTIRPQHSRFPLSFLLFLGTGIVQLVSHNSILNTRNRHQAILATCTSPGADQHSKIPRMVPFESTSRKKIPRSPIPPSVSLKRSTDALLIFLSLAYSSELGPATTAGSHHT